VLSGFYTLPFHSNHAVSGWQFAIINTMQSGNPLQPNVPSGLFPSIALRPDVVGPVGVTGNPAQWVTATSSFASPCTATGTVTTCSPGDMVRNSVIGPDYIDTDFSLIKDIKTRERMNLQFRSDAFDVFNHPNFGNPNLNVLSSRFRRNHQQAFPERRFRVSPAAAVGSEADFLTPAEQRVVLKRSATSLLSRRRGIRVKSPGCIN
jgi:hypothetical protein